MPHVSKLRRWLRRLLIGAGIVLLLLVGLIVWVCFFCFADPPTLDYTPAILSASGSKAEDGRARLGASWFQYRKGHSLLYVEGDAFTIGYTNARLTTDLLVTQEESLWQEIRAYLPGSLEFFGVYLLVLFNNRNLPDYVPREYQIEILGMSRGGPQTEIANLPLYHRILNYHAAHDIAHWVWDKPVAGCTAFAAAGAWTRNGHLWIGRNFDFEAGRVFDENKIIGCYRPARGHTFLSVAWPGMAGAVTGMNDTRLYCSVNGAHSADRSNIGTPVSLVVRQVLQYADSIASASRIIRDAKVFVADSYLVADGKTGEAVVVEKSPKRTELRIMRDGLLLQANHFESRGLRDDKGNLEYMRIGTSLRRRERLAELLERNTGRIDAPTAVTILRDRLAPGGHPLALGNRAAIDGLIATHSIVADVTAGVLWVSRGPHTLGAYDAYAIARFGEPVGEPVPADPVAAQYAKLRRARELIERARRDRDLSHLTIALQLNPDDADALGLLADIYLEHGRTQDALRTYRAALNAQPAFAGERSRIEEALRRLR